MTMPWCSRPLLLAWRLQRSDNYGDFPKRQTVTVVPNKSAPKRQIEWNSYSGQLSLGADTRAVAFRAGADPSGEIELEFEPIKLDDTSKFIFLKWHNDKKDGMVYFSLSGIAVDGTRFETTHLSFNSLGEFSDASGTRMTPKGRCAKAVLTFKLVNPAEKPVLQVRVKGFKNFRTEPIDCDLGKVHVSGLAEFEDANIVTGTITVQAQKQPDDVAAWHTKADRLAEHVRDIMSLASSSVLRVPLIAFYDGDTLTVTAWSQGRAASSAFPIFHFLDLDPIFKTAVRSFFDPPIAVNRLSFAIEWFAMDAIYNEIRLVAAMTALENLIDSNVTESEGLILPKKAFDRTRKVLLNIVRACVAKWATGNEEVLSEINETLAGLNRRSMLRKLKLLAQRWNVPLHGISDESMRAAKNARDRVVHRGQYYEDAAESDADLWTHVTVIREIAVRFLLTAIGFEGRYYSYIGGYHDAVLPPTIHPKASAE
jgi:hypothetical protein